MQGANWSHALQSRQNDCGIIDVPQNLLVCGVGEVWPGSDSSARTKRRRDEFAATAIMSF
jgi:hypothetical protein